MPKITRRGAIAGAAGLALPALCAPAVRGQDRPPIRIAWVGPVTGQMAFYGAAQSTGARIAVQQINAAGGIDGRKLELIIRDDKVDPNQTVAIFRELAASGITLFVGGLFTNTAMAAQPVLTELNSVFMMIGAISDAIIHESYSPNAFRIVDGAYMRMHALARLAAEHYPDVLAWTALIPDNETGHSTWNALVDGLKQYYPKLHGKQPVILPPQLTKAIGATDFKNEVSNITNSPAQGMFNGLSAGAAVTMYQQARPFGLTQKIKAFVDIGQDFQLAKAAGHNQPPNFWTGTHWYFGAYDNPMSKALYDAYVAETGDRLPQGHLEPSHGCVHALAQAIKLAGSDATPAVIDALHKGTFSSAKGEYRIRPEDNQGLREVNIMEFNPIDAEPGWKVTDFVRIPGADVVEPPSPGKKLVYPI